MQGVRITVRKDGKYIAEHVYMLVGAVKALERFMVDYHDMMQSGCQLTLEGYDSEENADHYNACKACGCVHFWR